MVGGVAVLIDATALARALVALRLNGSDLAVLGVDPGAMGVDGRSLCCHSCQDLDEHGLVVAAGAVDRRAVVLHGLQCFDLLSLCAGLRRAGSQLLGLAQGDVPVVLVVALRVGPQTIGEVSLWLDLPKLNASAHDELQRD